MRSDTCTAFLCEGAAQLGEKIRQGSADLILVSSNINDDTESESVIYSMTVVSLETQTPDASYDTDGCVELRDHNAPGRSRGFRSS